MKPACALHYYFNCYSLEIPEVSAVALVLGERGLERRGSSDGTGDGQGAGSELSSGGCF